MNTAHLSSQFTRPALLIDASFRLVFKGGATHEILGQFVTSREALEAYQAAVVAGERLDAICRGVRI